MELHEVGHQRLDVVERVRAERVPRDHGLLPRRQRFVALSRQPLEFLPQAVDLAPVSGIVRKRGELLDPLAELDQGLLEAGLFGVHGTILSGRLPGRRPRGGTGPAAEGPRSPSRYIRSWGSTSAAIWTPAGGRSGTQDSRTARIVLRSRARNRIWKRHRPARGAWGGGARAGGRRPRCVRAP